VHCIVGEYHTVAFTIEHAGVDERPDISMHRFNIPADPAGHLAIGCGQTTHWTPIDFVADHPFIVPIPVP
jgi:hypothetical protein